MRSKLSKICSLVIILTSVFWCCTNQQVTAPVVYERGEIVSETTIASYDIVTLNFLLSLAEAVEGVDIPFPLLYSVEAVKLVYQTVDANGNNVQASGALIVPQNNSSHPVINVQHGTQIKRDDVASEDPFNSYEGVLGLVLGAIGYFTCVPDYLGLGVSEMIHPYVHAKSNAVATIDFLRAARQYAEENDITLNDKLFLAGYSEGGYNTLATQKEMEQHYADEFDITAVSPMAGPYDLKGAMNSIMQHFDYSSLVYVAFILTAYDDIYQWGRLSEFFQSPYADMMTDLFSGEYSYGEINDYLPETLDALLHPDFIANFQDGNETDLAAVMQDNTLLNWSPVAPIRFYHGDADDVVPYQNSLTAVDSLQFYGAAQIELITIPGGTHETAALPSVLDAIAWFNSFLN